MKDLLGYLEGEHSNSYDAVLSGFTLHNCLNTYRRDVYKEVIRVLKPGGIFVNIDKYAVEDEKVHKENLEWQIKQFEVFEKVGKPEMKKQWVEHYHADEDANVILKEVVYIDELKNVGFVNIEKIYRNHLDAVIVAEKV